MKTNIFGAKRITNILYGLMVLLPMFSILGRVIYTQSNPNAHKSYSNTLLQTQVEITNQNKASYFVNNQLITYLDNGANYSSQSNITYFSNISLDLNKLLNTENVNYVGFRFYTKSSGFMIFFDSSNQSYNLYNFRNYYTSFTFTLLVDDTHSAPSMDLSYYGVWYAYTYKSQALDNAFEYSLQTFVDDNNLGNVNLFSWFTDMFLDQSKSKNALYLNFINWYLNYTLLVSSGYLLFMVMIWFTQYVRKIMDKSMYQDFGGF